MSYKKQSSIVDREKQPSRKKKQFLTFVNEHL